MSHNRDDRACRDVTPLLVHGLTFYQPEASLVAHGEKLIDTRSWGTDYRGWVAIHAARATPADWLLRCGSYPYAAALMRCGLVEFPQGEIVAFARLEETVRIETSHHAAAILDARGGRWESRFGDYAVGRRAWLFERVVPLTRPLPCPGGRGLWHWTPGPEAREAIAEALGLPRAAWDVSARDRLVEAGAPRSEGSP